MNDNVKKVQELYAAFGRGDIAMILDNVADDVTWGTETDVTEVPWYAIRRGREGVADFFDIIGRELEFTNFDPNAFAGGGDDVMVHLDISYKLRKNGRGASTSSIHRFSIRDGKVAKYRAFEDTAAVRDAWMA